MIRQDDVLLNNMSTHPYKEGGCALMCEIFLGVIWPSPEEYEAGLGYTFDRKRFVDDCDNWTKSGALTRDLVVSWNKIAQDIGLPYRIVREGGTHVLPPSRRLQKGELQIALIYNPRTKYRHFVVMNEDDKIVYDPLGMSVTQQDYAAGIAYIESRRVFRRVHNE